MITLASLFDGISGFPLAGQRNGIVSLWASEIEPFPMKVSAIRFPDMVQHGDITKINGAEVEPVDIITGGSPCQDLSVAGKRAGLAGERSGLFMEQVRIVREMRENEKRNGRTGVDIRPRFMLWENVPGAFSSNKGEDFRAVLEETARIADETIIIPGPPKGKWNTVGAIMGNGYSIAWRVLDTQYWGVPQRRRRIFLVADFGGQSAPEILFKRKGLRRDFAESGEEGQGIAADVERGTREAICNEIAGTLDSSYYKGCGMRQGIEREIVVVATPKTMLIRCGKEGGCKGALIQDDKSATLSCANIQTLFAPEFEGPRGIIEQIKALDFQNPTGPIAIDSNCQDSRFKLTGQIVPTIPAKAGTGGNNGPMLAIPVVFNEETITSKTNASNPQPGDPCHTLGATGAGRAICIQGSMIGRADKNGPQGDGINEDVSFTLNTTDRHAVAFACNQRDEVRDMKDKSGALQAQPGMKQQTFIATKVYGICSYASNSMKSDNPHSGIYEAETSRTLDLNGGSPACNQGGMAIVQEVLPFNATQITSPKNGNNPQYGDPCHPLCATDYAPHIAQCLTSRTGSRYDIETKTLPVQRYSVRRLTPLECDRLQDYPDNWTLIPGASDSARYKADGNSIAVCCAEYVLEGIKEVLDR